MDRTRVTPVAVIGMGCRLPGGIDSPDRLWEALLRGDDLVTEIPADRWDIDEYYDPEPGVPGRTDCKWGPRGQGFSWGWFIPTTYWYTPTTRLSKGRTATRAPMPASHPGGWRTPWACRVPRSR